MFNSDALLALKCFNSRSFPHSSNSSKSQLSLNSPPFLSFPSLFLLFSNVPFPSLPQPFPCPEGIVDAVEIPAFPLHFSPSLSVLRQIFEVPATSRSLSSTLFTDPNSRCFFYKSLPSFHNLSNFLSNNSF